MWRTFFLYLTTDLEKHAYDVYDSQAAQLPIKWEIKLPKIVVTFLTPCWELISHEQVESFRQDTHSLL